MGESANSPIAAFRHMSKPIYGVQFHPEVAHTPRGAEMIGNFLKATVCRADTSWTAEHVHRKPTSAKASRSEVGDCPRHRRAVGWRRLSGRGRAGAPGGGWTGSRGIFVDTGLLRKGEREQVERTFRKNLSVPLVTVDAEARFLDALAGVHELRKKSGASSATHSSTVFRAGCHAMWSVERRERTVESISCKARCTHPDR